MESHSGTKLLIETVVKQYVDENPEEFSLFCEAMKQRKDNIANDFAELKAHTFLQRQLAEYPETLYNMLLKAFKPEDELFFRSKEGMTWFVQKFPAFAVPDRV